MRLRLFVDVEEWHRVHGGEVIVWSLGGEDYARKWGRELLKCPHSAMAKENLFPGIADHFIDDDPLPSYRAANTHPDELE